MHGVDRCWRPKAAPLPRLSRESVNQRRLGGKQVMLRMLLVFLVIPVDRGAEAVHGHSLPATHRSQIVGAGIPIEVQSHDLVLALAGLLLGPGEHALEAV